MSEPIHPTTDRHTPGPWSNERIWDTPETRIHARVNGGVPVALAEVFTMWNVGEKEANARLIAAAPELLALAKQYARECAGCSGRGFTVGDDGVTGRGPDDVEPTRYACEDCEDIRAVIAKAEGRS